MRFLAHTRAVLDVAVGQEFTLAVYALAYGGEGIAKHQGLVFFIPETAPGDEVRARVVQVKKQFVRAEVLELIRASPERRTPFCPVAGACGGCSWQHMTYPAQLEAKRLLVENALLHVGRFKSAPVLPAMKSLAQTGYRHKIQIPFQAAAGRLLAGFYAKQSHRIVPFEDCPAQPAAGNRVFRAVRELAGEFGYRGYDEARHAGDLRHLVIRIGHQAGEAVAILVTAVEDVPRLAEFAAALSRRVPEVVGVVQNVNPQQTNVVLGRNFRLLHGRGCLYETVRGLRFRVSAPSFFQINPLQLPVLAETVLAAAQAGSRDTVLDLYCGVGWLTLELARLARRAIGVESAHSAVDDARTNLHLNHAANVEFLLADVCDGVRQLLAAGFKPDVVVIDPPRKGCAPGLLPLLRKLAPGRIVYVSCNPVTLARDLAVLCSGPYQVQSVQPVDMFPHTYHVESVASLVRKSA